MNALRPSFTDREAAALHIAGDLVLRVVHEKGEERKEENLPLQRAVAELERILKADGAVLTESGWSRTVTGQVPRRRR